jgi:hypothetical protein
LSLPLTDGVDSLEGLAVKPSMAQACPRTHALPEWVRLRNREAAEIESVAPPGPDMILCGPI